MDSNWYSNPKFLMLKADRKHAAIVVYWTGIAWTAAQGQDGFIPHFALGELGGTPKIAEELIEVRLWVPCEGGWEVHNYLDRQPAAEVGDARREQARKAAKARWAKERAKKTENGLKIV